MPQRHLQAADTHELQADEMWRNEWTRSDLLIFSLAKASMVLSTCVLSVSSLHASNLHREDTEPRKALPVKLVDENHRWHGSDYIWELFPQKQEPIVGVIQ